ncbi:zinc metalloproteinase nas-4-like [Eriocheir sinensis]|uniref:zinc metalloproteinase nas-4-like n=1 Tax=Eriocheir sinensis TaxID=95602 RepID=UPI0021CA47AB|nr:zinc metalloproteinase nas-4-like [Eriocheir sinensis]
MNGAVTVYFLALVFITQAAKKPKPEVPKTTKQWTPKPPVNAEEVGKHFEGDIILPLPGLDRSGLIDEKYRWPNGEVPYEIGDGFSEYEMEELYRAMREYDIRTKSCIQFIKHTNQTDYLVIRSSKFGGCSSSVGRRGGEQTMELDSKCFRKFGTILHEMLHTLGFFHEQSRTDRDSYVKIIWKNINDDYQSNFRKYSSAMVGPFGVGYDYGSVMHYSSFAFSSNDLKTIVPLDTTAKIGQRLDLSKFDVRKLMNMYKCEERE